MNDMPDTTSLSKVFIWPTSQLGQIRFFRIAQFRWSVSHCSFTPPLSFKPPLHTLHQTPMGWSQTTVHITACSLQLNESQFLEYAPWRDSLYSYPFISSIQICRVGMNSCVLAPKTHSSYRIVHMSKRATAKLAFLSQHRKLADAICNMFIWMMQCFFYSAIVLTTCNCAEFHAKGWLNHYTLCNLI